MRTEPRPDPVDVRFDLVTRARNRGWMWFSLIGIGLWVGLTVAVAVINDDPADGRPVLLAFGAGGAVFFLSLIHI